MVQYARSLRERRARERERAFLVEGPRVIADAMDAGFVPHTLFWSPARSGALETALVRRAEHFGARVVPISEQVLEYVAETVTPQAVLAIFPFPEVPLVLPSDEQALFLIVDRVQDPGNLGTLLRSALGAGAHAVFLSPGTVDAYNPKVVRAAAGAHFRLPIRSVELSELARWAASVEQFVVADPRATLPYDAVDWTVASALVIGSEAHGIAAEVSQLATRSVAIPLRGGLESLNAAVAGSVILFEAARQRRSARREATTPE